MSGESAPRPQNNPEASAQNTGETNPWEGLKDTDSLNDILTPYATPRSREEIASMYSGKPDNMSEEDWGAALDLMEEAEQEEANELNAVREARLEAARKVGAVTTVDGQEVINQDVTVGDMRKAAEDLAERSDKRERREEHVERSKADLEIAQSRLDRLNALHDGKEYTVDPEDAAFEAEHGYSKEKQTIIDIDVDRAIAAKEKETGTHLFDAEKAKIRTEIEANAKDEAARAQKAFEEVSAKMAEGGEEAEKAYQAEKARLEAVVQTREEHLQKADGRGSDVDNSLYIADATDYAKQREYEQQAANDAKELADRIAAGDPEALAIYSSHKDAFSDYEELAKAGDAMEKELADRIAAGDPEALKIFDKYDSRFQNSEAIQNAMAAQYLATHPEERQNIINAGEAATAVGGEGEGAPAEGGEGAPAEGEGEGAPAEGGEGAPAEGGEGEGAPAEGEGEGAPAEGEGAPAEGDPEAAAASAAAAAAAAEAAAKASGEDGEGSKYNDGLDKDLVYEDLDNGELTIRQIAAERLVDIEEARATAEADFKDGKMSKEDYDARIAYLDGAKAKAEAGFLAAYQDQLKRDYIEGHSDDPEGKNFSFSEDQAMSGLNRSKEIERSIRKDFDFDKEAKKEAEKEPVVAVGFWEKIKNKFRKNGESKKGAAKAVEKTSKGKEIKKWIAAGLLSLVAAGMMYNAIAPYFANNNNVAPNTNPTGIEQVDTSVNLDQDDSETERNHITVNYYSIDSNGERTDLTENLGDYNVTYSYGQSAFNAEVGGRDADGYTYADAQAGLKEGPHSFGAAIATAELNGDVDLAERQFTGERAERLSQDMPYLTFEAMAMGSLESISDAEGMGGLYSGASEVTLSNLNNNIALVSMADGDTQQALYNAYSQDWQEKINGTEIETGTINANESYMTFYMVNTSTEKGMDSIQVVNQLDCSHDEAFSIYYYQDADGNNVLDQGIYKLNILKLLGVADPDLTLEEAEESGLMDEYTVRGYRGRCGGQPVIQRNGTPNDNQSGAESSGSEPTGSEPTGSEPTGSEPTGSEPTGSEPTGSEPTGSEPTGSEPTGTEPTGTEPTGTEPTGSEPTGSEITSKTDDPHAGEQDQMDVTPGQEESVVVEETDDNSAANNDAGSEVTTRTEEEQNNGEAAGAGAITDNQGVTDQNGAPVQNQTGPNTGGQVVTENGTDEEAEQATQSAQQGTATTYDGTETNTNNNSNGGESSTSDSAATVSDSDRQQAATAGQTTGTANSGSSTSGDTQEDLNTPQSDADLAAQLGF